MRTALLVITLVALGLAACSSGERDFYGLEMSGQLVGYVVVTSTFADDGAARQAVSKETFMKLTLLGRPVDVRSREEWELDPASQRPTSFEMKFWAGPKMEASTAWTFDGDVAHYHPGTGGRDTTLVLDPDVFVDDGHGYSYLRPERMPAVGSRATVRVLDLLRGAIGEIECTRRDDESLIFDGRAFDCSVYDTFARRLGVTTRVWIGPDGKVVKLSGADGTTISRAEPGIRGRVRRASVDDMLFADVEQRIETPLVSLEVEATIRSAGRLLTTESLNVPGQRFTGTVEHNRIEGVFEIERLVYDGVDAPPFPPRFGDERLQRWLEPEMLIESDDPVLIEAAADITSGATDAWDAVTRIATWIGENLSENVPGGSARQTYDAREGECGSHARLTAALCRASGIPCRLVSGAMYTLIRDGSFGQHAWNEVYMGDAGWVALDTTVDEVGGVDAGHVRLGEQVTFNPVHMEILNFRAEEPSPAAGR